MNNVFRREVIMKKILFLADLHGNMPATLALEKEIEKIRPDDIWFLGDAVGKGPESDKTLDWVRSHCNHFISGKERLDWLESLPQEDEVLISGINFRLIHGRPIDINFHPYLTMDELRPGYTDTKGKLHNGFISADCHMPYVLEMDLGYAINTGSVGNSLGVTRCHALLIEGELGSEEPAPISINILSIPYDNQEAANRADNFPLPCKEAYKAEVLTGVYSR